MAATIELILDATPILSDLSRLAAAGDDLSPAMRQVAGLLADAAEEAFAREADPSTWARWQPLGDAHIERRRKVGKWPGPILQMSGQLAASVQSDYGRDFAQVGSNKVYAAIHQHGSKPGILARNAAIPARPFLGVSDQDREEILDILSRHLADALG